MKRAGSVLLWSAISAAFIGPGTVTTAAAAGARHGTALLWALLFSTVACLALQEASARLAVATGKPLARTLGELTGRGPAARLVPLGVVGSVVLGCAAFQAGNILGAVAGAGLAAALSTRVLSVGCGLLAAGILLSGKASTVARILGGVVALMGAAFAACAVELRPPLAEIARGSLVPTLPPGSGLLALGLVGTTVVPYNLFLGSGLARGGSLKEARFGLAVAVPLGGLISMAVLMAGTACAGPFSFHGLAQALSDRLGAWAGPFFAFGLFAAGLSSAVTAPLAAALAVRGCFEKEGRPAWKERSLPFRAVWAGVLLFGLAFGIAGVKPVPVIILAQALNGVVLPLVAAFLWIAVNDRNLVGRKHLAGPASNVVLGISVPVTVLLGCRGIAGAAAAVLPLAPPAEGTLLAAAAVPAVVLVVCLVRTLRRRRHGNEPR